MVTSAQDRNASITRTATSTDPSITGKPSRAAATYRMIWRWHFYAGLFCIPLVIWLATTGSIYLFRPQIEAWIDRPWMDLPVTGPLASPAAHVTAALAAIPGSTLITYQLPEHDNDATQVLVQDAGNATRVYVHPQTLQILHRVREEDRPMRVLFHLHGELLLGDRGSIIVELAASWAIVLLLTGLYLWWPSGARGLAGVLYPRINARGRVFWRDLHGVTALWVSAFALFLLISGLPWSKSWSTLLREARQLGSTTVVHQDWPTGADSASTTNTNDVEPHEDHSGHAGHIDAMETSNQPPLDPAAFDRIVRTAQTLGLATPVLISPPSNKSQNWTAKSDSANRPQRGEAVIDATAGHVISRTGFADRPMIDRIVGYGVAAHEGQLFGWFNQALGVFTALGLILVSVSALKLWWARRTVGTLGALPVVRGSRVSLVLAALIIALAIVLPLLGLSLMAALLLERLIFKRVPAMRTFLGLSGA